jgi:capsular polysaccharide biosynthesis protein
MKEYFEINLQKMFKYFQKRWLWVLIPALFGGIGAIVYAYTSIPSSLDVTLSDAQISFGNDSSQLFCVVIAAPESFQNLIRNVLIGFLVSGLVGVTGAIVLDFWQSRTPEPDHK